MDPFLKRLVEAIQKDGIHGGDLRTEGLYLPNYHESWGPEICEECGEVRSCKYDKEHLFIVPFEPTLSDFEEADDWVQEEVFETAVYEHAFENLPEGKNEFDFSCNEYKKLIEIDEDFEETLIEKYEEHESWMGNAYEDLHTNMRSAIWPVYLFETLGEVKRSAAEIATLINRVTNGYVYLLKLPERHRPADMRNPYGFVAADAGSDDMNFRLAMAYVCAQNYPPPALVSGDFIRHIKQETNMHDGTVGWCVMVALRTMAEALNTRSLITEEIIGSVNTWLDETPIAPVKHMKEYTNMEAYTTHRNAMKLKEARAALSMLGITTETKPEE